jgi:hypothetical protein
MSGTPITNDTTAPSPERTPLAARPARLSAVGGYLRLELSRTLRDGRYLLLAVIAPVGFYLLFSAVFGGRSSGPSTTFGLPAATEIMVAMATFGAMWAALSATAPRLARDREGGWSDYLATTPLRAGQVLVGAQLLPSHLHSRCTAAARVSARIEIAGPAKYICATGDCPTTRRSSWPSGSAARSASGPLTEVRGRRARQSVGGTARSRPPAGPARQRRDAALAAVPAADPGPARQPGAGHGLGCRASALTAGVCRIRRRSGSARSRSTTWTGGRCRRGRRSGHAEARLRMPSDAVILPGQFEPADRLATDTAAVRSARRRGSSLAVAGPSALLRRTAGPVTDGPAILIAHTTGI